MNVIRLKDIPYQNIKKGDVVVLEGSSKTYVAIKHGQVYHFIPIVVNSPDVVKVNEYDIHKPSIKTIFDGKNGKTKFIKEDEENGAN